MKTIRARCIRQSVFWIAWTLAFGIWSAVDLMRQAGTPVLDTVFLSIQMFGLGLWTQRLRCVLAILKSTIDLLESLRAQGWRVTLEGTQWHTASRFWRCDLAWVNPNEYRLRISEYGATPEEAVQKAHAKAEENKTK